MKETKGFHENCMSGLKISIGCQGVSGNFKEVQRGIRDVLGNFKKVLRVRFRRFQVSSQGFIWFYVRGAISEGIIPEKYLELFREGLLGHSQ